MSKKVILQHEDRELEMTISLYDHPHYIDTSLMQTWPTFAALCQEEGIEEGEAKDKLWEQLREAVRKYGTESFGITVSVIGKDDFQVIRGGLSLIPDY